MEQVMTQSRIEQEERQKQEQLERQKEQEELAQQEQERLEKMKESLPFLFGLRYHCAYKFKFYKLFFIEDIIYLIFLFVYLVNGMN